MSDQHKFLGLPEPTHRPAEQVIADAKAKGDVSREAAKRKRSLVYRGTGALMLTALAVTNPTVQDVAKATATAVVEAPGNFNERLNHDDPFKDQSNPGNEETVNPTPEPTPEQRLEPGLPTIPSNPNSSAGHNSDSGE